MRKALFIGGTGTISRSITERLARDGNWEVYVLNRGQKKKAPDNVRQLIADINNPDRVKEAVGSGTFDVVANFIAYSPEDVQRDIDLFRSKTRQYIFISSASAYQKPATSWPITESTPLANPFWDYSRDKIACENLLLSAYRSSGFPVTIVRPSHTYNNENFPVAVRGKQRSWQTFLRLRDGRPVIIPGDGTSLWTVTHADDFAPGFIGLMANPQALGQAFHITSDDVLTWDQIYGMAADAIGVKLNAVHIASETLAGSNPEFQGTLLGDKAHTTVFDNAKIRKFAPQFSPVIRLSDAIHTIIATMLSTPSLQVPDPEFDAWCERMLTANERWP